MNIREAALAVSVGAWIRRRSWGENKRALFFNPDGANGDTHGFRTHDGVFGCERGSFSDTKWSLSLDDLLAHDWVLVDETSIPDHYDEIRIKLREGRA